MEKIWRSWAAVRAKRAVRDPTETDADAAITDEITTAKAIAEEINPACAQTRVPARVVQLVRAALVRNVGPPPRRKPWKLRKNSYLSDCLREH